MKQMDARSRVMEFTLTREAERLLAGPPDVVARARERAKGTLLRHAARALDYRRREEGGADMGARRGVVKRGHVQGRMDGSAWPREALRTAMSVRVWVG